MPVPRPLSVRDGPGRCRRRRKRDADPLVFSAQVLLDWDLPSADLVDGNADLPQGAVMARECSPVSFTSMSKQRISRKLPIRSQKLTRGSCCRDGRVGQVTILKEPCIHLGHARLPVGQKTVVHVIDGAPLAIAVDKRRGCSRRYRRWRGC